jgi:AAA15 family ATPase/GTPase
MDVNVDDIIFEEEDYDANFLSKTFTAEFLKQFSEVSSSFLEQKSVKVIFEKAAANGAKVTLPIGEESTGTRALYNLAGPLHDTLENGYCLLIDEINTSLHPLVIQLLVRMFESERTNPKRAQIIFTSHDVSILRDDFLRRDQVWFIENDGCEAKLVPLSDYSPRRREALERGYLMGRYGGIPAVSLAYLEMADD